MAAKPLTLRQAEALEFIKSFVSKNNYPPTIREIKDHMNYQSTSTAFNLLEMLVSKGFIKKGNGPRELKIVGSASMAEKDAEIGRLREALESIAGMDIIGSTAITMKSIAQKALSPKGGETQCS
jgi:repressor LexA